MTRLAALFDRALAVSDSERSAFIKKVCGADEELRQELTSLLEAHERSDELFDDLAVRLVSPAYAAIAEDARRTTSAVLMSELQGALEGGYRIERELGGGGMSRVFLAEEVKLGRKVVIKVLPPDLAATMSGERFRREIQLAAQLQHPHIVPLLTSDAAGAALFYTMPFMSGESLRDRLRRDGALPIPDALRIWRDVLDALAHAHARQVVHRDIKPGNILLCDRNALVADFGIARAIAVAAGTAEDTASGLPIGTPAYMAPEQFTGDDAADFRVDIYAAGLVMYEMLEGRLPFALGPTHEVMRARRAGDPLPIGRADCPRELSALVLQCLAQDPADRPESADALLAELETLPGTGARPRRRMAGVVLATGLVALLGFGTVLATRYLRSGPVGPSAATVPAPTPTLAVFPLTNLGSDADAALADGMTEELVSGLGGVGHLRVIASTSVLVLKNRQLDVRQIADSLRLTHFLEGAVQRVGSRLRVRVRLVDARDGSTRWSETYDRELGDIFAVQDDISRAVAGELDVRLAGGESPAPLRRPHTPGIVAYHWYLRGKNSGAVEDFQKAIAADSNFAPAYARMAWACLYRAGTVPGDHAVWHARAEQAALRAVALDDALAEAHSALGWVRYAKDGEWGAAEAELKRAVAIDPAVHRGYEGLAKLYLLTGRPAEQLAAARRGLDVDPYSVQAIREMALALNVNDRCDETLELLRPLKGLSPPPSVAGVIMGLCYARKQRWPDAIAEFRWAMDNGGRMGLGLLGYALARGGRPEEARSILADLLAGRKHSHGAFGIALVYTGLRDYDQAFVSLYHAAEESSTRPYIMDPVFEDLHRDPRWDRARVWRHRVARGE